MVDVVLPTSEQVADARETVDVGQGAMVLLAWTLGNAQDAEGKPFFDPTLETEPSIYYALSRSDRVGVSVDTPPGGGADVLATKEGAKPVRIEIAKPRQQRKALKEAIGLDAPEGLDGRELEAWVIAAFGANGYVADREDPFVAALREGSEEQGIELAVGRGYEGVPLVYDLHLPTKRSFIAARSSFGSAELSLERIENLRQVEALVERLGGRVDVNGKSLLAASHQRFHVVRVPSFAGVVPVLHEGEEGKIPSRIGERFKEEGVFQTLSGATEELLKALETEHELREKPLYDGIAAFEILAAAVRLEAMRGIERHLVKTYQLDVVSSSSRTAELLPTATLPRFAGKVASIPLIIE